MKKILILSWVSLSAWICVAGSAWANVTHEVARVFTGWVSPSLTPFGAFVTKNGDILYVGSTISTLSPKSLRTDCWYAITYTVNEKSKLIQLVPPQAEVSCGHDFGGDK